MKRNLAPMSEVEILEKMRKWCAYQERSQDDARKKMHVYHLNSEQKENMIAALIAENFLNEERFAVSFARGKFRIKHWGKIKIKIMLKKHGVNEACIRSAILSIDENEYKSTLKKILIKKTGSIKGDRRKKFAGALSYAVGKGFESDFVIDELNVILGEEKENEN